MRVVKIEWEGPFTIDQVLELNDKSKDFGLYQIYGRHVIFGVGSLLYIGKTEDTFSKRVKGNYADWKPGTPWYQEDREVSARIGRLYYKGDEGFVRFQKDDPDFSKLLRHVEGFQIFCHSPPYNGTSISSYNGQSLIVGNVGERGGLCEQLSTTELNDSGMNLGEDAKYFLEVVQADWKAGTCKRLQSDVFEAANKKPSSVRLQALNEVLREELRGLFEKRRWSTSGNVSHKTAFLSEHEAVVLSIIPINEIIGY